MQSNNGVTQSQRWVKLLAKLSGFIIVFPIAFPRPGRSSYCTGVILLGNAINRFTRCWFVPYPFTDVRVSAVKRITLISHTMSRFRQKPALYPS